MRGSQLALLAMLLAASACRIEDRTPTGTRRDEDAVQSLVAAYARTLSERYWIGTRRLFWRDGSYSGPLIPRSVGQTLTIDSKSPKRLVKLQPNVKAATTKPHPRRPTTTA